MTRNSHLGKDTRKIDKREWWGSHLVFRPRRRTPKRSGSLSLRVGCADRDAGALPRRGEARVAPAAPPGANRDPELDDAPPTGARR